MDDDALQGLRKPPVGQEGIVLSPAPKGDAQKDGSVRVFGTSEDQHDRRAESISQPGEIPHRPGQPVIDADLRITTLLKRIMAEAAAPRHQDDSASQMSNLEVLVRGLVDKALDGNQFAMETVLDRFEGKPVRANQVQTADTALEEQLDKASVAALNSLTENSTP